MNLDCGVCLENYNQTNFRPYSISCGHTVCMKCTSFYVLNKSICPFCKQLIVNKAPNYAIIQLLDQVENDNSNQSTAASSTNATCVNESQELSRLIAQGDICFKSANYKNAIMFYDKALKLSEYNAELITKKGKCFYNQNDLFESIKCFEQALNIEPHCLNAYNSKAFALKRLVNNDESIDLFYIAIQLNSDPNNVELLNAKAESYFGIDKYPESVSFCSKAIELDESNFDAHMLIANAYSKMGDFAKASRFYQKSIELQSKDIVKLFDKIHNNTELYHNSLNPIPSDAPATATNTFTKLRQDFKKTKDATSVKKASKSSSDAEMKEQSQSHSSKRKRDPPV